MSRHPLAAQVERRAKDRCEYCLMHQQLQGATFHIEHIVPESSGGPDELSNLCLACPSCNLHKSDRTVVTDPETGALVPLFHPRHNQWSDHFEWQDYQLFGR